MSMTIDEQNKWLERNSRYGEVNENVIRSVFGSCSGGSESNTIYLDAETEFWPLLFPNGNFQSIDKLAVENIAEQLKSGKRIIVTIEKEGVRKEFQLAYADGAAWDTSSFEGYLFYPEDGGSSGYYWKTQVYTWNMK